MERRFVIREMKGLMEYPEVGEITESELDRRLDIIVDISAHPKSFARRILLHGEKEQESPVWNILLNDKWDEWVEKCPNLSSLFRDWLRACPCRKKWGM